MWRICDGMMMMLMLLMMWWVQIYNIQMSIHKHVDDIIIMNISIPHITYNILSYSITSCNYNSSSCFNLMFCDSLMFHFKECVRSYRVRGTTRYICCSPPFTCVRQCVGSILFMFNSVEFGWVRAVMSPFFYKLNFLSFIRYLPNDVNLGDCGLLALLNVNECESTAIHWRHVLIQKKNI